ncbi:MAG: M48 family peptidase [Deltaproteobacteria bacterium]|nr:MAG: M48 family peptidase [Deltaproteobacteria bacterium]
MQISIKVFAATWNNQHIQKKWEIGKLGGRGKSEIIFFDGREAAIKWSRRRRTIGLTVTGEGEVVVLAPQGASRDFLQQALAKHRDWIAGKVAERREAWAKLRQGDVFFQGTAYRLALQPGAAAPVALEDGEIRVKASTEDAAWPLLKTWCRRQAERLIRERVDYYTREMRAPAHRVELKEWKRRWGECHPREALRFNWRLILLPPEILDYVVVHELAHLLAPGHTPRFWQRVEQVLPDYGERRQWLNRYGAPFLLWRLG